MDQFSAHLDRGWELISRNDPRGAEASARRALELDPQSPEAYNLLGYCAALDGNADEAIEAYRQAIALDDTYFEAMLNAAEVYIHPLRDYLEAIKMCEQAIELAETDEELVDAMLLKFDALMNQGEEGVGEARALLERLPLPPYENPVHTFLVGRALFELGEVGRATPLIEEAATKDPKHAEAWYYLGLVRAEQGNEAAATEALVKARELDLLQPSPPWSPSREAFAVLCRSAINRLDSVLGSYLRYAEIYVSDVPGFELVVDGVDPRTLLLFDGISPPDRPHVPCTRVFFYQRNLERFIGNGESIEDEIHSSLEREITLTFLQSDLENRPRKELNLPSGAAPPARHEKRHADPDPRPDRRHHPPAGPRAMPAAAPGREEVLGGGRLHPRPAAGQARGRLRRVHRRPPGGGPADLPAGDPHRHRPRHRHRAAGGPALRGHHPPGRGRLHRRAPPRRGALPHRDHRGPGPPRLHRQRHRLRPR